MAVAEIRQLPGAERRPPRVESADALMRLELREPRWAVPGIHPEGLNLLVGPPKTGKSWYCLNLGVAVATGGQALGSIELEAGEVLYLALEDTLRRLKTRLHECLGAHRPPPGLHFATDWPRQDQGGIRELDEWLKQHPRTRLVIVDTLQRFRPAQGRGGAYEEDYTAGIGLKRLGDNHQAAVIAVHHTRKAASNDPLETVSGTNGLVGAADAVQVLKRDRDQAGARLYVTGRDVEQHELTLRWDPEAARWSVGAKPLSSERQAVIAFLARAGNVGCAPKEVADALAKPLHPTQQLLWRMKNAGQIGQNAAGLYLSLHGECVNEGREGKR